VATAVTAEPVFHREGELLVPTAHARGPWHAEQLHGGAPAALLAGAVQDLAPEMQVARLTYDFLGPVPLAPLRVKVRIVKPGRRFQLAVGELAGEGGRMAVVVRAALLRRGDVALPEASRWHAPPPAGGPGDGRAAEFPVPPGGDPRAFQRTAMDIRVTQGAGADGRAQAWLRLTRPLVGGEPVSPVARVAAAADFGNGVSRVLDFATHLFTNVDLTISLLRDPASEWVMLDARTVAEATGIGWAASTLHDEDGAIGSGQQTLFIEGR
jgi:acyl-coenzyme A thioesterase PaaI-like protein